MKQRLIILTSILLFVAACSLNDGGSELISSDSSGSGTGGSLASFTIVDDYLYVVDEQTLKVTDISNPSSPEFVKTLDLGFGIETIFPKDDKLFIGTSTGMFIFELTDPEDPQFISFYDHIYSCDPVVADNDFAYVTLNANFSNCGRGTNELQIIDISNLYEPKQILSTEMTSPRGLTVSNDTLWVCDTNLKMYKLAEDRKSIQLVKTFNIEATDVIKLNNHIMVIGDQGFYQYQLVEDEMEFLSSILTEEI